MNEALAVEVSSVSKIFKLPHEKSSSIKGALINFRKRDKGYEQQQALENVSFEVKQGEFFGIVGRNGSGKSTLLKTIAGIYAPNTGNIQVNGKLTPFIELGVGFNPELSGRENVFLNGALLGFNRKEMDAMYNDIVAFAELERFMDQKLKNYSSGMQVRLAFSISIRANTDILILDEVLAVGDAAFQQKCFEYFEELKRNHRTVILVTHDMNSVMRFCDRALMLKKGKVEAVGSPQDIANKYLLENISDTSSSNKKLKKEVTALTVKAISSKDMKKSDNLVFQVGYNLSRDTEVDLGYSIINNGFSIAEQNTKHLNLPSKPGVKHEITCTIPVSHLNPGSYSLDIAIFTRRNFELIGYEAKVMNFIISGFDETKGGPLRVEGIWEVKK